MQNKKNQFFFYTYSLMSVIKPELVFHICLVIIYDVINAAILIFALFSIH